MVTRGCKIDEVRIDGNLHILRSDLERFAALGIKAVEIPVHGVDAVRNGLLDRQRVREVVHILKGFDFAYSVHSPNPLNLMDQEDALLHHSVFQASLEFTATIGAKVMVYHAGRFIPEETFGLPVIPVRDRAREERLLASERESLGRLADEFPEVVIGVENARPYLFHSPYCYAEQLDVLRRQVEMLARPNIRITLDIGHLYMASKYYSFAPLEAVRRARKLIAHVHVHDNFGGTIRYNEKIQTHQIPFGRGDSHMPIGWGAIPIQELLAAFIPDYSGLPIMELRSRYFHHLQESNENLARHLGALPESRLPPAQSVLLKQNTVG